MQPEQSKQQERVERILDTAAALLLRWGYKRVTVDDVAERAEIGKGTIYLHWKTKDALFQTLLIREAVATWRALLQRMRDDASEVRLSGLMRAVMLITLQRPLARALFVGDVELLGKLAGRGVDRAVRSQQLITSEEFVVMLRRHGLLQTDMELAEQMYALQATITGFLLIEPLLAGDGTLTVEQKATVLARTIERAFEPAIPSPTEVVQVVAEQVTAWMEQVCADYEHQMRILSGLVATGR